MSTYQCYKDARNAAWHALLQLRISTLPVDMDDVMEKLQIEAHPCPTSAEQPRLYALLQSMGPSACATLRIKEKWHVFFRRAGLTEAQRRFALAHELGHILLRHETYSPSPGVLAFSGQQNDGDVLDDPQDADDYAADIFAVRFLSPACVLHETHLDQAGAISDLCGLPPRAAAQRAERMQLLNARDAFFTSADEIKVRDQFLPFIRARNTLNAPKAQMAPRAPAPAKAPENPPPEDSGPFPPKSVILLSSLLLLAAALILSSYFGLVSFGL